jgi:hypothetical protein
MGVLVVSADEQIASFLEDEPQDGDSVEIVCVTFPGASIHFEHLLKQMI